MKRNNNSFYAGVMIIIVIASFVYSWKFLVPQYQAQQIQEAQVSSEMKMADLKLQSIKKTEQSLAQLTGITDQLFVAVPSDKDTPNLITELESIGGKYGITIPGINISDSTVLNAQSTTGTTSSNAIMISLSLHGSFENLSSFMGAIEKDVRFMNIKSITLANSDSANTDSISLSLQIEAYKRAGNSGATGSAS